MQMSDPAESLRNKIQEIDLSISKLLEQRKRFESALSILDEEPGESKAITAEREKRTAHRQDLRELSNSFMKAYEAFNTAKNTTGLNEIVSLSQAIKDTLEKMRGEFTIHEFKERLKKGFPYVNMEERDGSIRAIFSTQVKSGYVKVVTPSNGPTPGTYKLA